MYNQRSLDQSLIVSMPVLRISLGSRPFEVIDKLRAAASMYGNINRFKVYIESALDSVTLSAFSELNIEVQLTIMYPPAVDHG